MKKLILLLAVLLVVPTTSRADSDQIVAGRFVLHVDDSGRNAIEAVSNVVRSGAGARRGGAEWGAPDIQDFNQKLSSLVINGDKLAQAVSEVLHLPLEKVKFISREKVQEWNAVSPSADIIYVTLRPINSMSTSSVFSLTCDIAFKPAVDRDQFDPIKKKYLQNIAGDVKEFSQKYFDDMYEKAHAVAEARKDEEANECANLSNQHRNLQLQSYAELPYEKVADHLADLQRQQLTIKLSLVGMEARRKAIREQIDLAQERMAHAAEESKKNSDSNSLLRGLRELVQLRTNQAALVKQSHQSGVATATEVSEADAKVLEAKIQLYTEEAKSRPQVNSEQLDSLNNELTRLEIDRSEAEARLKFLEQTNAEVSHRIARRSDLDQEMKDIDERLAKEKPKLSQAETQLKQVNDAKANFTPIDITASANQ